MLEVPGSCPRILVTIGLDCSKELMYADGACREALLMFKPPQELGSETFNLAYFESGPSIKSARTSRMVSLNDVVAIPYGVFIRLL